MQFIGRGVVHAHYHAPIVQQQLVANTAILDQIRVIDTDHFLGAGVARMGDGEAELVAFLQLDALVGELGDADLRALQVAQQCDEAAMASGDLTDQLGPGTVLVGAAVGEVQAGDIQPGDDHLLQHIRRTAGRAQGGDDLGATLNHSNGSFFWLAARLLCSTVVVIARRPLLFRRI